MHAAEREELILSLISDRGFIAFQELDGRIEASPATIRRDLDRLHNAGRIIRVRGGARLADEQEPGGSSGRLTGIPFHENLSRNLELKQAIGRAGADFCRNGDSIIIDGGSTTLQMCPHLADLRLQVLTNSLHIVSALLPQQKTSVVIPAGTVFREQNIVLSPYEEDGTSRFRATRMFMGAAAVGRHGVMQTDFLLVQAERRLMGLADELIVMVDSSKFEGPAGHSVCALDEISVLITDDGIREETAAEIEAAVGQLLIVPVGR